MRAGCFFCTALSLMIVYVFGDIWRIERRTGRPVSAIGIGVLAAAVLAVGALFGRCALTGVFPSPPGEETPCR